MKRTTLVLALACLATAIGARPALADHAPVPTITSPADGTSFCVPQGSSTAAVTVAGTLPEATDEVRLYVDGALSDEVAGSTDWSFPLDLQAGDYSIEAASMAIAPDETEHESAHTAPVAIIVENPPVGIGSLTRSLGAFSPNGDGYKDTVTFTADVDIAGQVRFVITRGSTVVQTTGWLARGAGSSRDYTWDGGDQNDGTYTAFAEWRPDAEGCARVRSTSVVVDTRAPSAARSVRPATFYPAENDAFIEYKDNAEIELGSLSEEAKPRLEIRWSGDTIATYRFEFKTGGSRVRWNGRRGNGELFPEGEYAAVWTIRDRVGNVRTYRSTFELSHKHLEKRMTVLTKRADAYRSKGESGCGDASTSASDWAEGVWFFVLDCYYDDEIPDAAFTDYRFSTPPAAYHHNVTLHGYGYSLLGDDLFGLFYEGGEPYAVGAIGGYNDAWRTFGTRSGERFNVGGRVDVTLFMFSPCDCVDVDYDIRWVALTVRDGVLRY